MSRFIETIKLLNGKFFNLPYHEKRRRETLHAFYPNETFPSLEALVTDSDRPPEGLYKCRITYDNKINNIEFTRYQPRKINSLKIVNDDRIEYNYKYEDRKRINELFENRGSGDDIIIIKNSMVSDSSYANLLFKTNDQWITPSHCLLKGTMRQFLLDSKVIKEQEIQLADIKNFEKVRLINSMVGNEGPEIAISQIQF